METWMADLWENHLVVLLGLILVLLLGLQSDLLLVMKLGLQSDLLLGLLSGLPLLLLWVDM
jgi:hypothetical protein